MDKEHEGAFKELGLQDEAVLLSLSAILDKICDVSHKTSNLKSTEEKPLLLSRAKDFLLAYPNSTPSQLLRWLLNNNTGGSTMPFPRFLDNNVLTPDDVKSFMTLIDERESQGITRDLSKDDYYIKLIAESDQLAAREKDEEWMTSDEIEELGWQLESLQAELSQLSFATSTGKQQILLLSQTEKELSHEVEHLKGHLKYILEPSLSQVDRQLSNIKIRMDQTIQKLIDLAEHEKMSTMQHTFDEDKLDVAQKKFKKNLIWTFQKNFPISTQSDNSTCLKDLKELSSIYSWTLKEVAKCSTSIEIHQKALECLSQENETDVVCPEKLQEITSFFEREVHDYCTQKSNEDIIVVGKLLAHFRELSELTSYCNRMEFIKDQLLEEMSRKTAVTLCCHAYQELQGFLSEGIKEFEDYLESLSKQSNERITWLHSLRDSIAAWPTPSDHQVLMAVSRESQLGVDLDEMTSETYHQKTNSEIQYWEEQLATTNSALHNVGSFERRLANSSAKCHQQLASLAECYSTLPHHYPVVNQEASDCIETLKKSTANLRSELVSLLKKSVRES